MDEYSDKCYDYTKSSDESISKSSDDSISKSSDESSSEFDNNETSYIDNNTNKPHKSNEPNEPNDDSDKKQNILQSYVQKINLIKELINSQSVIDLKDNMEIKKAKEILMEEHNNNNNKVLRLQAEYLKSIALQYDYLLSSIEKFKNKITDAQTIISNNTILCKIYGTCEYDKILISENQGLKDVFCNLFTIKITFYKEVLYLSLEDVFGMIHECLTQKNAATDPSSSFMFVSNNCVRIKNIISIYSQLIELMTLSKIIHNSLKEKFSFFLIKYIEWNKLWKNKYCIHLSSHKEQTKCECVMEKNDFKTISFVYYIRGYITKNNSWQKVCIACQNFSIYKQQDSYLSTHMKITGNQYVQCWKCKCTFYLAADYIGRGASCTKCRNSIIYRDI